MTILKEAKLRRQFDLPEEDVDFLDAQKWVWETAVLNGVQWLLVHDFKLPKGFTVKSATLGIRIVPGYPAAALDMVYVCPPLSRMDGGGIGALSLCSIDGRDFQQWSRHYAAAHPWRPDVDNVSSHLRAAEEWFQKAVK
jgi:hypothetical protein